MGKEEIDEYINKKKNVQIIFTYIDTILLTFKYKTFDIKINLNQFLNRDDIKKIFDSDKIYELMVEVIADKYDEEINKPLNEKLTMLLRIIQQSNFLITKSETISVLENLKAIHMIKHDSLNVRKPISLVVENMSIIENNYGVTDKADGERVIILINNMNVNVN